MQLLRPDTITETSIAEETRGRMPVSPCAKAKPKLLDLFCGVGGASMGYSRAGFDVTGVDIEHQREYPFNFIKADAMTFPLEGYDFIHASPPCQAFTVATNIYSPEYPNLLTPIRKRLKESNIPFVIENVPNAPMRYDIMLCGSMFGDNYARLRRHRWFELWKPTKFMYISCKHVDDTVSVFGHGGHTDYEISTWQEVMGIDWTKKRYSLAQAIPPIYTEFLGKVILQSNVLIPSERTI